MGVGFTRSFSLLCPSVSPGRGIQPREGGCGLRGTSVAPARPGYRRHFPSRIFPMAVVSASPVPLHPHRPQGLPAPLSTSAAMQYFSSPPSPAPSGVGRAWGCPSVPNFRVAGAGILQQMLTHSGRTTSWLLCREGLALGSGRWERSGARAAGTGQPPAGAMRVFPAGCYTQTAAQGSITASQPFIFVLSYSVSV